MSLVAGRDVLVVALLILALVAVMLILAATRDTPR